MAETLITATVVDENGESKWAGKALTDADSPCDGQCDRPAAFVIAGGAHGESRFCLPCGLAPGGQIRAISQAR